MLLNFPLSSNESTMGTLVNTQNKHLILANHGHDPLHQSPVTREGADVVVLARFLGGSEAQDLLLTGKEQAEGSDHVRGIRYIATLNCIGIGEHPVRSLTEALKGPWATDDEVVRHRVVIIED